LREFFEYCFLSAHLSASALVLGQVSAASALVLGQVSAASALVVVSVFEQALAVA
jgi:hypothetical protein